MWAFRCFCLCDCPIMQQAAEHIWRLCTKYILPHKIGVLSFVPFSTSWSLNRAPITNFDNEGNYQRKRIIPFSLDKLWHDSRPCYEDEHISIRLTMLFVCSIPCDCLLFAINAFEQIEFFLGSLSSSRRTKSNRTEIWGGIYSFHNVMYVAIGRIAIS